ncbi:hypothetical protein STEG23_018661, partial [Scotinomys teguina]
GPGFDIKHPHSGSQLFNSSSRDITPSSILCGNQAICGSAIPGLVVLGSIKKKAEQTMSSKPCSDYGGQKRVSDPTVTGGDKREQTQMKMDGPGESTFQNASVTVCEFYIQNSFKATG